MKKLFMVAMLLGAAQAYGQIALPIAPVSIVTTTTVTEVRLMFSEGHNWITVVRPYVDEDGRWGRFIDRRDMQVDFTWTGNIEALSEIRTYLNDLRVTGDELEAAGVSLGIDWAVAKGDEEMLVMMQAFLTKVASIIGQDANWVAAVRTQLISQIGGP